ncbi:MAG: hypothetical protein AAF432_06070 [Planctomycetota bacterium]
MHDSDHIQLIRQYVDGELDADIRADFEARLAEDAELQRRVTFEQTLRDRVGAHLSRAVETPVDLEARIRGALRDASSPTETNAAVAGSVGTPGGGSRANWFAVAACLAIVAGAVLFGIFGPSIDDQNSPDPQKNGEILAATTLWTSEQHSRCTMDPALLKSMTEDCATPEIGEQVMRDFLRLTDCSVKFFELEELGFQYLGGGKTMAPGDTPAFHVVYMRPRSHKHGGAMLSFFMVRAEGEFEGAATNSGTWKPNNPVPSCRHKVLRTLDDDVVMFMVCCDQNSTDDIGEYLSKKLASGMCEKSR